MRNLHQIILQEYGLEALHLFRDRERLWLRASNYKNHRIFTLRCIHKDLVPVSIKLKTTIKRDRARKIIKNCREKSTSGQSQSYKQYPRQCWQLTELCRSKLVSIISTQRFTECQGFVERLSEIRFNKSNKDR